MPTHQRVLSKDEELGKRNDDFRPQTLNSPAMSVGSSWSRRKRWRALLIIAGIATLYFFLHAIPSTKDTSAPALAPLRPADIIRGATTPQEPVGAPPRTATEQEELRNKHYFDGKIRFYRLAASLHGIRNTQGMRSDNRNVLFAASSLKSLANLLPLACQMGMWKRNYVHLALMGRDALPIEDILEINGFDIDECKIIIHDARSDYSEYSTDRRAEASVVGALKHINDFMHPQAIVIDDAALEDPFFVRGMRYKADNIRCTLMELPAGKYEDFTWMTKLDSGSLANWHRPNIDILINAPWQSSGGLLRLVKSLEDADYAGLRPPRLTIELPPDIDPFLKRYLQYFQWPPQSAPSQHRTNTLALHHRISSSHIRQEEASLRFLESFYPTNTQDNHVLILSPSVELSPSFFHYLHYTILEYKYSAWASLDSEDLLGISLDVPATLIDGQSRYEPPTIVDMTSRRYTEDSSLDKSIPVPFLYGAPSSTASLIFGDKWVIFHNFLRRRIEADQAGVAQKAQKLVTTAEPAWMEYLLELIRAKGWFMLHPSTPLVLAHNDMARIPEEFTRAKQQSSDSSDEDDASQSSSEPFLTTSEPPTIQPHREAQPNPLPQPLHLTLPFDGDLPELQNLPYMNHLGVKMDIEAPKLARMQYSAHFRRFVGGCSEGDAERMRVGVALETADDLFCLEGMDVVFGDEEVEAEDEREGAEAGAVGEEETAGGVT